MTIKRFIPASELQPGDAFRLADVPGATMLARAVTRQTWKDETLAFVVRTSGAPSPGYFIGARVIVEIGYTNRQAKRQGAKMRRRARLAVAA